MGGKGSDKVSRLPNCDSSNRLLPRRSACRTLARLLISIWLRIDFYVGNFYTTILDQMPSERPEVVNAFLLFLVWRLSGASDHPQRLSTLVLTFSIITRINFTLKSGFRFFFLLLHRCLFPQSASPAMPSGDNNKRRSNSRSFGRETRS